MGQEVAVNSVPNWSMTLQFKPLQSVPMHLLGLPFTLLRLPIAYANLPGWTLLPRAWTTQSVFIYMGPRAVYFADCAFIF